MEEFYKKYGKLVYHYLRKLCENKEIAEELTQETFYKAIKGVKNFRGECSVSNWLCHIAKNVWLDYLKKEHKIQFVSIDDDSISNFLVDEMFQNNTESKEEQINLYKKIHQLNEKTREIFYLRLLGGFSFKEIAKIFDKSEEWARTTFYRGKRKLKEEIENDEK